MPPRPKRQRKAQRQQQTRQPWQPPSQLESAAIGRDESLPEDTNDSEATLPAESLSLNKRPTRSLSQRYATRSLRRERVVEKVDYTQDYNVIRRELFRIAFWSVLLFVSMFVVYFVS
jgi:hypothetical protein